MRVAVMRRASRIWGSVMRTGRKLLAGIRGELRIFVLARNGGATA